MNSSDLFLEFCMFASVNGRTESDTSHDIGNCTKCRNVVTNCSNFAVFGEEAIFNNM